MCITFSFTSICHVIIPYEDLIEHITSIISNINLPNNNNPNSLLSDKINFYKSHPFMSTPLQFIDMYPNLVKWPGPSLSVSTTGLLLATLPPINNILTIFMNNSVSSGPITPTVTAQEQSNLAQPPIRPRVAQPPIRPRIAQERLILPRQELNLVQEELGHNQRELINNERVLAPQTPIRPMTPPIPINHTRVVILGQLQDHIRFMRENIDRAIMVRDRLRDWTTGFPGLRFEFTPGGIVYSTDNRLNIPHLDHVNRMANRFHNELGSLGEQLALLDFIISRISHVDYLHFPEISDIRATIQELVRDPPSSHNYQEFFTIHNNILSAYVEYFMRNYG